KQQQARQEAAKKIEELLKRQREATSYGGELIRRAGRERETPTWKQDTAGAADRQGRLRDDTATVADELGQQSQAGHQQQLQGQGGMSGPGGQGGMPQQGPQMPGVLDQAKQHLDQAVGFQEQATGKLADNQPTAAQPRQKGAEEQLEKALEALNKKEEGDQQQQQQQQQQAGDEDQKKEGEENEGDEKKEQKNEEKEGEKQSQEGEQRKKEEEEGQQKQAQAVPDEKARDILDEERENRERRRPRQSSGHRAIDRDW
ncbi:MAG: hypothetical protein HON70_21610, partial [Lentisphaerae bacterium]|nr:hypothetical protein [Lentisphaerota bacterium]